MAELKPPRLFLIALEEPIKELLKQFCPSAEFTMIDTEDAFGDAMENITSENCDAVVCGSRISASFSTECGQLSRQQCGAAPVLFITTVAQNFDQKGFIKNGYSAAFLLPMDRDLLKEEMHELELRCGKEGNNFKPVYVVDLDGETELAFSTHVYLPLNKKFIKFSNANSAIKKERLEKLAEKDVGKLLIDKADMTEFYKYSAAKLAKLGKSGNGMSETERKEKLNNSVRGMFTNLIDTSGTADFAKGKELVADCQKIVSMYITGGASDNWYNQLVRALSGASNTYDHASSVSTLAALLAIGLELPNPEDVAMAGFLHDLGRASTPEELINTPLANWPEDLRAAYLNHPVESMNVIKTKKMVVPKEVERAILQHHEMYNGKGFPKQLAGDRISAEAQVLSLADQFFYLTVELEGKKRLSPKEAFLAIKANESISPVLLKKLEPIITGEGSVSAPASVSPKSA